MSLTDRSNQALQLVGILSIGLLLLSSCKRSSVAPVTTEKDTLRSIGQPVRVSSEDADAAEPAIAASPDGSVYVAWVNHGPDMQADVMIARLNGQGQMLGSAVRVNSQAGIATAWRGDPPTVAVAPDHTVFVGWTARVESDSSHATNIYLSASRDYGQTFGMPVKVNDDTEPGVHGIHSLGIGDDGRIFLAWLDERNITPMPKGHLKMDEKSAGRHLESNREVFFASSLDGGHTFTPNRQVAKDVCPCCKTALAIGSGSRVYLSWRQVLPGDFRHIAIASSADGGKDFSKPVIVSDDQWLLKGCPVTGAALLPGKGGKLRVLWYAAGEKGEHGIYWSESRDGGQTFSPRTLLDATSTRATPALAGDSDDGGIWGVWEGNENGKTLVRVAQFTDNNPVSKTSIGADPGELPTAASTTNQFFIAYIVNVGEMRSIWLVNSPKNPADY
jgi:hypothetical protein